MHNNDMFSPKTVNVTFSTKTIIRVVLVVTAVMLGLSFLSKITHPLTLIFVSFFLAIALNPAVSWISKRLKSRSRIVATGVAYIIVVTILAGLIWLIVPPTTRQGIEFVKDLPRSVEEVKKNDTPLVRFIERNNLEPQIERVANNIKNNLDQVGQRAVSTAGRVGGVFLSIITVFVLTFMMLVEGPLWLARFWAMQDPKDVPKRKKAAMRMYRVVTGYVNGQLLIALIAGSFAFLTLLVVSNLLDVSVNAVVYATIVTIVGLVPLIGNTIAAVIVVLLCAFTSLPLAIIMLIFFVIYQQIENVTLQPYIQAKNNELTPLLVFIAALIGIGFGGFLGALIAIPAMGCLKVFITEFYGERLGLGEKKDDEVRV